MLKTIWQVRGMDEVIVGGAGIGGLTLGLALHDAKISCRIFESAAEIKAVGVGINLLPHATKELATLGLECALAKIAIATTDATFFNRFGQLIYQEPLGRTAGYDHPQFSIHRGDLQRVLLDAFFVRAGWMSDGKMVIYPIRPAGADGKQLINWVAEIETPHYRKRDWTRSGSLDDFIGAFSDWDFEWLDVPAFIRAADHVLEFPMVDQDPLPRWSFDRTTLLRDAAHPLVPRGSNGAGPSILDARALTTALRDDAA